MNAQQWLQAQRDYWGIEAGLHQSLDASALEDLCRVRTRNSVWLLGMFRRLAVSVFKEWKSRSTKRKWTTMTDFHTAMGIKGYQPSTTLVTSIRPSLERMAS